MVYISVCDYQLSRPRSRLKYLVDPSIGKAAGFGGVILHGLSSYGFAARAIVQAVGGNDPASLTFFGVRFSSPVKPGDALETRMWEVGTGPNGATEIAFETRNVNSGKVRLVVASVGELLLTICSSFLSRYACHTDLLGSRRRRRASFEGRYALSVFGPCTNLLCHIYSLLPRFLDRNLYTMST